MDIKATTQQLLKFWWKTSSESIVLIPSDMIIRGMTAQLLLYSRTPALIGLSKHDVYPTSIG
jgi:hypothetical protein